MDEWSAWIVQSLYVQKTSHSEPSFIGSVNFPTCGPVPPGSRACPRYCPYPCYPYSPSYTANSTNLFDLKFDYGKNSDLLLNAIASTLSYNEQVTVYPAGSAAYFAPDFVSYPISAKETVTRTRTASSSVTLTLSSTSLDLNRRVAFSNPSIGDSSQGGLQAASLSMVYGVSGVLAAALVSGGVWIAMRSRRKAAGSGEQPGTEPTR